MLHYMCLVDHSKGWWQNYKYVCLHINWPNKPTHTNTITIVHRCPRQCHRCVWKSVVNKSVGHQPTVLNQHWSGSFIRESYDSAQITNPTISWIIYSHPFDGVIAHSGPNPHIDQWTNLLKRNMALWCLPHLSLVSKMKMEGTHIMDK